MSETRTLDEIRSYIERWPDAEVRGVMQKILNDAELEAAACEIEEPASVHAHIALQFVSCYALLRQQVRTALRNGK